jgi:ubiquinone/menaquinone biosynthesis C-methylase UbiE
MSAVGDSSPLRVVKSIVNHAHAAAVSVRRTRVLSHHFSTQFPRGARILDVGAGDGAIAAAILKLRPDVAIGCIDVHPRRPMHIPVQAFDGQRIPFPDSVFDCVMLVDVLHHTEHPESLIREAARVSRHNVLIKDHLIDNPFSQLTLQLMDCVGNWGHDVPLIYKYFSEATWKQIFAECGLAVENWTDRLGLYPMPFSFLFDRNLHIVAMLTKAQ